MDAAGRRREAVEAHVEGQRVALEGPRVREAQYLALSWKLGVPLALANIFLVGVIALVVPI